MADEAYTIPTGTPDISDVESYPWDKTITPSAAPNIWRLAEEIVKAKDNGPYTFRMGYVNSVTLGNPPTISCYLDGVAAGLVSGIRALQNVSLKSGSPVLILVMPGGMMIAIGSLTTGTWQDDSSRGGAILQAGGVNSTLGNGRVVSQYRIVDGMVDWYGHYFLGSSTSFSGALRLVVPPGAPHDTTTWQDPGASMGVGTIRAFNGGFWYAWGEMSGQFVILYNANKTFNSISGNTPMTNVEPFAWGNGNILSWTLRYPIAH